MDLCTHKYYYDEITLFARANVSNSDMTTFPYHKKKKGEMKLSLKGQGIIQ